METRKIKGEDVLDIQQLAGEHPYAQDSKLVGQFYKRFTYNGVCFTVNKEHPFCSAFDNGEVYAVTFGVNEEGQFEMVGFNTLTQVKNLRRFEAECKSFERIETIVDQEATAAL